MNSVSCEIRRRESRGLYQLSLVKRVQKTFFLDGFFFFTLKVEISNLQNVFEFFCNTSFSS